ncbi:unnamed protein product [Brugia pahangi]|uniref:WD_REPEATS_REGION domain-containing protein n=1 Tax=Brugia pahangi TaxID=6280 RepID=A0A158PR58_BRUPA|nr:unnamed protein product [Brugia pahangi]
MTSSESMQDRLGKTKVTAAFFKKLGEKLRNYQRYQKPIQFSGQSITHSSSLDLNSNIRHSMEPIAPEEIQSTEKNFAQQIAEEKSNLKEKKQQIQKDNRKDRNGRKKKLEDNKKVWKSMSSENISRKREDNSKCLTEQSKRSNSATTISKQSQSDEQSLTESISSSKSLKSSTKSISQFDDGIKTNFNLGNNNILSILKSRSDPDAIIYDLQNPNGCKIHLEKMANRAMLLSVDDTGKRLYISCNF